MMQYNETNEVNIIASPTTNKKNLDRCQGKCWCPNGFVATILVNILLWTALIFSGGSLVDCHLVEADILDKSNAWPAIPTNLIGLTDGQATDRRGFGFFVHEDANGDCRWEYWGDQWDGDSEDWTSQDEKEFEDYIKDYLDWMGKDWRKATRVACTVATLGFVLAVWAAVYGCVSHVRLLRYITGAVVIAVIMPMQFAVLGVMDSDFCKDRDCKLQRSGHFAIVAGLFYILAGVAFFFMKNHPGASTEGSNMSSPQEHHAKTLVLEEATHEDDAYTAEYGIGETSSIQGDGIEEARPVKAEVC